MAFPVGTPTVTLVGTVPSAVAGAPFTGRLVCKPSTYLVDAGRNAVYPGGGSVAFDADGSFSVVLLPCDASGVEPAGWRWYLDLQPTGGTRIAFYANITGTGTVHFDDLAPVPAPNGGPVGGSAVTSVNGETGTVVLSAADVGADPSGTASTAVAAHAAATDPHGDRTAAAAALSAHEANTTAVHGIADTALLETQAGAQAKATAAQNAATTAAASALSAHEADTTTVHGITDTSALETATGATAKVTAHKDALDPHGDRAWADNKFATQVALSSLDGFVNDALTRVAAIEGGTAWLSGLQVAGNAVVSGGDLTISDFAKGYRFRRGGSALDFEATGADMILSNWSGTGFNGTQYSYLRFASNGLASQIAGQVEFVDALYGTTRHTLDGAANKLGFHGAAPVTRQTVTGTQSDGAALASLLSALATVGLITNSSTVGQYGPQPSDQGLITWTGDPNDAGHVTAQSSGGVAGRITLVRIPIREQITWSNIWLGLSGIDAGASLSNCYLGVYNAAGTLMGATADISSSFMTGAVAKALPLTAPFTAPPGFYYIAMLLNGTWTTNSLHFKATGAGISVNANLTAPNLRYSNMLTGQTSLPGTLTMASQVTTIINTGWGSQWYGVS
ncbi:hypothetical protein ACFY7H_13010 [Streptomyces sp. NPDC012794]|uniref:hypothetical protein n=1 Tax=Streptomyces sp. NPDC012794 TaxID=3364850 RepID=UPI00368B1692